MRKARRTTQRTGRNDIHLPSEEIPKLVGNPNLIKKRCILTEPNEEIHVAVLGFLLSRTRTEHIQLVGLIAVGNLVEFASFGTDGIKHAHLVCQ